MLDLKGIAAGIQILKETYSVFSALQEVRKDQALLDKLREILDLQATLLDAKAEILTLRGQLQEHEQAKKYAQEMKFDERVGVFRGTDEGGNQLAYCHKCWVENNRRAPLRIVTLGFACATCSTFYRDPDKKDPPTAPRSAGVTKSRRW